MSIKKTIAITLVVGVIGAMGIAYAATAKTPAEIASSVTGKTVTDVTAERNQGKTYGTIANEAGKLDEFQTQMLEERKADLDQRVKNGTITQEQADAIYNNIKTNQLNCDGEGSGRMGGQGCGGSTGQGCGMNGGGRGNGQGFGRGR